MDRIRERVAILFNYVWHSAVIDFGCVSSRIIWIKFRFSKVKVCVVVECSPSEGDGEERDRFWNDMDRILDRVGITGAFGVPGKKYNGKRPVEFCAQRGLCVVNS